jgi:TM2 domain-containing membrane protein YozV
MATFCSNCGNKVENNEKYCPKCGKKIIEEENYQYTYNTNNTINTNNYRKSKMAAGLLGIFLGSLGIHNFYLGYNSRGITQLLLTLLGSFLCGIGPIISGIWGLVEGIQILTGSINTDANGNPLID